jgi:hypothetical protein
MVDMEKQERRAAYASLWILALAFGWIEASVVVYLREIYVREVSLHGPNDWAGLQITLVSLPGHLVVVEMAREACTLFLLGAVAWLAGRRPADRAGAFLLSFGIWDLTYYAALKLVVGWPDSLSAWDILFLIPLPWVAPMWAPVTIATIFVAAGSYLFWTSERERRYRWPDIGVLVASVLLTIAAFLVESRAAIDHRAPEQFPVWLFGAGVVLGTVWFIRVERGVALKSDARAPWVDVRVQTVLPERSQVIAGQSGRTTSRGATFEPHEEADIGRVIREYTEAKRRLDALVNEAGQLGERFERLAQGLSAHPRRMIIGLPERPGDATEWDVIPSHPLPRIEQLAALTDDIREAAQTVDDLGERLILMGRADLAEQPDGFFQ